ncbi:MAG TPA: alpha/beta hydrolase family protein [Polyangia bacterium]|nr:alpha/beta hydrolase family protein [Polyangia bacterium]
MHSVLTVEHHAPSLDRATTYTALIPDTGTPPFAVLYQLHGASDDHRAWLYKSNILRHVDGLPLVVVMPSGENSYYVDAWERMVVDDLPAHVARTFRVREGRAAIGGLSMGGFGAIRLGLKYPEKYVSIYAHSSKLVETGDDHDAAVIAAQVDRKKMPALAFDCGVDDYLIEHSRKFAATLKSLGVPHEYREHPGAHTWDYWEEHLPDALAHHKQVLGL